MTNMYFQLCSFFYMVLISILFFSKKRVKNLETRVFSIMSVVNIIGIILDIIIVYLSYVKPGHISLYILNKFYLMYIAIWTALFVYYIVNITLDKDRKKVNYMILFLTIVVLFLISILEIKLYNLDNVMYTYGPSVTLLYMAEVIYILITFFILVFNIKKIFNKKYVPLLALIVICFFALIIRLVDPGILLTTAIITFINVVMYHTIENPDMKMIEQLNIAKASAEKANRAKSDFLSSMSHEIRTPLNAIVGFSEMIENENTIEGCKENAKDIVLASHTLLDIVNGILDISKIEANKMEIVNKEYSLLPELNNLSKLLVPRIGEKPIELKTKFAEDIPAIMYGDIGKIKQIITNILTNAAKYTEQGEINFTVNCINEGDICSLVISVEDTGRGIKPEKMNTLFTKFNRLDEDKNTTIEGTGLGLAITKSLTEMMGGKIVVQSVYGKGSKFTIYLRQKIVAKEGNIETKEEIVEDIKFTGFKVLVVDDNNLNLKVADKLLKKYDLTTKLVESGQNCIDLIKLDEVYDLILMDDMMPKLRGPEVLAKLKEIPNFNIPVIALTANATAGIKESYIKEGFNDYLAKPIDKIELTKILKKYLTKENNIVEDKQSNDLSGTKVLVVDDNKLNIKIATSIMKDYNFEIDGAFSGKECIEKVKIKDYDIIFMDYMMPEMDGIETLHHIKDIPSIKSAVVALTADATDGSREKFLNAGFDEYVAKPINKEILNKVISKMLIKKQTAITDGNINNLKEQITDDKIDYLKQNGINVSRGIELLGDIEMYNETLNEFLSEIDNKMEKLSKNKDENIDNYAIDVHALKSDSKYLGFELLAKIAFEHEIKAKEHDKEYILNNFDNLKQEVNNIIKIIKNYINNI